MTQLAFLNQALEHVDGGRHVFESLTPSDERDVAANGVQFATDVFNAPPIKRQPADLIAAVQFGNLHSDDLWIRAAAGECQQVSLLRPHRIRHPIRVRALLQDRQPTKRQDVEASIIAGED